MSMELRDYQASAVEEALASLARGGSVLLIAPTGSGKTVMFAAVVARYVARRRRVLVVAHRRELLTQAHDKLAAAGVASHVHRARKAPIPRGARVVVASVRKRLDHLQTHNPEPAVLFGAWRADSVTEAKIHRALLDHRVMREWYPWNDAVRREVERFAETHVCVEDVGEINAANEASNARAARKGRGRAREILRAASASTPTHANR